MRKKLPKHIQLVNKALNCKEVVAVTKNKKALLAFSIMLREIGWLGHSVDTFYKTAVRVNGVRK